MDIYMRGGGIALLQLRCGDVEILRPAPEAGYVGHERKTAGWAYFDAGAE